MSFQRLQFFPFISFFCLETLFAVYTENFLDEILLWNRMLVVMNSNQTRLLNCRMCFVHRKIRQGRWQNKMAEADMEIATKNKQKAVVRVG